MVPGTSSIAFAKKKGYEKVPVAGDCALDIEPRYDVDKGGYDSYVFPVDARHPVWSGILPDGISGCSTAAGEGRRSQNTG